MTTKTNIILRCDYCGCEAERDEVKTHTIVYDYASFEIDACAECWRIETSYVRITGRAPDRVKPKSVKRRTQGKRKEAAQLRAWALSQELMQESHGRIPLDVRAQWYQAGCPAASDVALEALRLKLRGIPARDQDDVDMYAPAR